MGKWTLFPHLGEYRFDAAAVRAEWSRLHAGDAEPPPQDPAVRDAWVLFHNGHFEEAARAGLAAGPDGSTVANKSTAVYANYLEKKEKARLEIFTGVAERAQAQAEQQPHNANAWYWLAYALGHYSQGISVAKALAQGLGGRVKEALERTIKLQPLHADAHAALGSFHAEVIDKVGSLIGGMTYGAKKETGLALFREALRIHPASVSATIAYADGLVMLEGEKRNAQATRLYQQAAGSVALDAMERLDVELAKTLLAH
jgi:hypothetical protein